MWSATPSLCWPGVVPAASTQCTFPLACGLQCIAESGRCSQHLSKMLCALLSWHRVSLDLQKGRFDTAVHAVGASLSPDGIV